MTRNNLIGQIIFLAGVFESVFPEAVEVCISEDLQLSCLSNQVILVTSAEFGRMEVGKCIKREDEFLGCTNDVTNLLDKWCSGRQKCSFEVTNEDLEAANKNCLEILMKYLMVEYVCLNVHTECTSHRRNILSAPSGIIASHIVDKHKCGSARSPWIISANPGQTIHLDILDFSTTSQNNNLLSCRLIYGFIIEESLGINHTICAGYKRQRNVYKSKTNSVEIHLLSKEKRDGSNFILKYSVTGCSEIKRPTHAWYKREGDEAVIGCENNDKEWRLKCVDNKWVGEVGNCSEIVTVKEEDKYHEVFSISSVVVVSGIAGAAVVLSVIAIVSGVVYVNKYRMKQEMKRANLYKTYSTIGSNLQAYYRPVTVDQSENNATSWDMSLQPANQMTLLSEKCTCPTLQMRNQGAGDKTDGDRSLERQSLYSSIRST